VHVLLGVHWQNEWLTFLPFWALMAWRLSKARLFDGGLLIGATGTIFGIAAVSLIFVMAFVGENEPGCPSWRQLAGPGELFPSDAAVARADADCLAAA
jgi:hypothetical protein